MPDGLEHYGGRVDLRGLPFPPADRIGSFEVAGLRFESIGGFPSFTGVTWTGIDLSGSVIDHARFTGARISDCLFERASLTDWRLWDTTVEDSSFANAKFIQGALATGIEGQAVNRYRNVSFDGADLKGAHFTAGYVHGCTFRDARLQKVHFNAVDFEDVVFSGLLDEVEIDAKYTSESNWTPGPMRRVDFSGALMRNCDVHQYTFDDVKVSSDGRIYPHYPSLVKIAVDLAAASDVPADADALKFLRLEASAWEGDWDTIFFQADWVAWGSQEPGEALARLLTEAESILASTGRTSSANEDPAVRTSRWWKRRKRD